MQEIHLTPKQFEPIHNGSNPTLAATLTGNVAVGTMVLVQEYNRGAFTGRWVRLVTTGATTKLVHVRIVGRSADATLRRRAA